MLLQSVMPMVLNAGKTAASFASKNSNALLTAVALTTLMGTTLSVISAVPKVINVEEKKRDDLEIARNDKERAQIKRAAAIKVAKIVVVPALMFFVCAGSIVGNAYLNSKKLAALAAAYALSEQKLEDIEKATQEIAGPKKAGLIQAKADEEDIARRASTSRDDVINTGHGEDLFWYRKMGYWMRGNQDFINLAFLNVQKALDGDQTKGIEGETMHINELHEFLNLPTDTELGEYFGWDPGDCVGVTLTSTGKHTWDDGTTEYYTVIDYTAKSFIKEGYLV